MQFHKNTLEQARLSCVVLITGLLCSVFRFGPTQTPWECLLSSGTAKWCHSTFLLLTFTKPFYEWIEGWVLLGSQLLCGLNFFKIFISVYVICFKNVDLQCSVRFKSIHKTVAMCLEENTRFVRYFVFLSVLLQLYYLLIVSHSPCK